MVAGSRRDDRSHPIQLGLPFVEPVSSGEASVGRSGGSVLSSDESRPADGDGLWGEVFSPHNLELALERVESNDGSPGVDGMAAGELRSWFYVHGGELLGRLDAGTYRPSPVRRVEIPKPDGRMRVLGVPTVVDRFVQQAVSQVLVPIFDPGFSDGSFGFRPGRGAHGAVEAAQGFVSEGYRWVVDVDLDSFFDRVNHDMLMYRVGRKVADRRLRMLIRRYLQSGVMVDGVRQPTEEGTPQGSPLSPLLSNIMLDDLDQMLEERGHRFVRYADDLRVFVGSQRAARRVLDGVCGFVEDRLKLRVNQTKSRVVPYLMAAFLGFGFYVHSKTGEIKIRVAAEARKRAKARVRSLTRRAGGKPVAVVIGRLNRFSAGWVAYFRLADTETVFEELDGWTRRRLRAIQWTLWKTPQKRVRALRAGGVPERLAYPAAHTRSGTWRTVHNWAVQTTLSNNHWNTAGYQGFHHHWHRLREP